MVYRGFTSTGIILAGFQCDVLLIGMLGLDDKGKAGYEYSFTASILFCTRFIHKTSNPTDLQLLTLFRSLLLKNSAFLLLTKSLSYCFLLCSLFSVLPHSQLN